MSSNISAGTRDLRFVLYVHVFFLVIFCALFFPLAIQLDFVYYFSA